MSMSSIVVINNNSHVEQANRKNQTTEQNTKHNQLDFINASKQKRYNTYPGTALAGTKAGTCDKPGFNPPCIGI